MKSSQKTALALLVAAIGASGTVLAQDRHEARGPRGGLQFDERYHHDHYYPSRGYAVPGLPRGAISIGFGGGNLYFHGGVWYRPRGGRFVVITPPLGIVVPFLPPGYVSLWIGGAPYYYANDVYYTVAPGQGYVVVAPPPGADSAQPVPPPPPPLTPPAPAAAKPAPEPVIYPRNGQSAAQTESDRQECNRWAAAQPNALADAQVFQRAVAACMEGRGYTLR